MQYYRCKCGSREMWGSMCPSGCEKCEKCGSNLAQSPKTHSEPKPHKWITRYNQITGKPYEVCDYCNEKKQEEE